MQQGGNKSTTETETSTTTDNSTSTTATTTPVNTLPNALATITTASNFWIKTNKKTWQKLDKSNKVLGTYKQDDEDDWSYYLSGPENIQIDVWTKKVNNKDTGKSEKITASDAKIKGVNVGKVVTESGVWVKTGTSAWEERTASGQLVNTYKQNDKDEWSVYLIGPATMQLDLWKKKAYNRSDKSQVNIVSASLN